MSRLTIRPISTAADSFSTLTPPSPCAAVAISAIRPPASDRPHPVAGEALPALVLRRRSIRPSRAARWRQLREPRIAAEHLHAVGQRLAVMHRRQLVDEALGEEAGIAVGIAAHPPGRQADLGRDVVDQHVLDPIRRLRALNRQLVGRSPLASIAAQLVRLLNSRSPNSCAVGGSASRARQLAIRRCSPVLAAISAATGVRGRPASCFLPARPHQLHRPPDLARDQRGLDRVIDFEPPVEAAARRHRIEHHIAHARCRAHRQPRSGHAQAPGWRATIRACRRPAARSRWRSRSCRGVRGDIVARAECRLAHLVVARAARDDRFRAAFHHALLRAPRQFFVAVVSGPVDAEGRGDVARAPAPPPTRFRATAAIQRLPLTSVTDAGQAGSILRIEIGEFGLVDRPVLDRRVEPCPAGARRRRTGRTRRPWTAGRAGERQSGPSRSTVVGLLGRRLRAQRRRIGRGIFGCFQRQLGEAQPVAARGR